ncbi:MAG: flagellar hook-basal body protein, partial [Vulcanimicrobiaceae bacterium]
MIRAMYAAATGMAAEQQNLDLVAENLANADVAGFKGAQAIFSALGPGGELGTTVAAVRRLFSQGKLMKSGGPCDLAIEGPGFFRVERDGREGFVRSAAFARAADGSLRDPDGWQLAGVRIPAAARSLAVNPAGQVLATVGSGKPRVVGRIALVDFAAPEALEPLGATVFAATRESGKAYVLPTGGAHEPQIAFGMLEKSNVSIVEA